MLIDTHCHLNFHAFKNDLDEVIKRAKKEGVEKIIIPGAKIDSSERAIEIAQKYAHCYAAVGIHPHHTADMRILGYYDIKRKLIELVKEKKVVAIGETGLDYHVYQQLKDKSGVVTKETKQQQKELFKIHLEVAKELNLPVIFHCREAFGDIIPIITEHIQNSPVPPRRSACAHLRGEYSLSGVFHCFGGTKKDLEEVLNLGFYIGFDGNITYKNADNLREIVAATPMDRLLLETDAPFLSPEPFRGQRNEPKNVKIVAGEVARIKEMEVNGVERKTTENVQKLFYLC